MKPKILLLSLLILVLDSVSAQFGYLDKTFSSDGIAEINLGTQKQQNSRGAQIIPNADGSLFVLFQSSESSFLLKKKADGLTDSSYGVNGLSAPISVSDPRAVKQPDGKIIIGGHTVSKNINYSPDQPRDERKTAYNEDFALGRFNVDGSIDKTFGNKGLQKTDFNTYYDAINSIILLPDGKILVSGFTALYDPTLDDLGLYTHLYDRVAVARYTNIGLPDLAFGKNGKLITTIRTNDDNSNLLGLQSDGKFIVAASDTTGLSIARFTGNGVNDNSFLFTKKLVRADKSYFSLRSMAIQTNDKIVLGGLWDNTASQKDFVIVRFAASGGLDNTFGNAGIQTTDFRGYDDFNTSLVIQNDGKIVAGGFASNGASYGFATSRYNTNGTPDIAYSADGKQLTYHGSNDLRTAAVSLQPDQKIIMAGFDGTQYFQTTNTLIVRYTAEGNLDKTYNKTGGQIYVFKYGETVFTSGISQPDGKFISAGYTWNGTDHDFLVVRYNIDGSLDKTFSGDGIQITNVNASSNINIAVALQKDGKIVISGSSKNNVNLDFALVRYNNDGTLDNTFSGDGILISDFGGNEYPRALAIQADGKIVIAGSIDSRLAVARYNADGSIDAGFGDGGKNVDAWGRGHATSVAIDGNGKIVVSGVGEEDNGAILRFSTDGSLDQTFGDNGVIQRNSRDFVYDTHIAIQKDNKILFAGIEAYDVREGREENVFLLRYNTNGNLDLTFSEDGGLSLPLPYDSFAASPSVALQTDGKIILSAKVYSYWEYGYRDLVDKPHGYVISRIKSNGSFDSTFGRNGLIYANDQPNVVVNNISVGGNKLYAVGYNELIYDFHYEITHALGYVARYNLLTANTAPKVGITSPANKTAFPSTTTNVIVNVTASDAEGLVQSVKIYLNDSYVRTDFSAPYSFGLSGLIPGVYVVKAKATDNLGVETFSTPVTFVIGKANPVVEITSPADSTRYSAPHDVTIDATADDPDGNIRSVKFYNGNTYIKTDFTAPYSYTFASLPKGNYIFKVKATDNEGNEVFSDPIHVLIGTTPPKIRIVQPGNNSQFYADVASVTIVALQEDADGYITRTDFYDGATLLGTINNGDNRITVSLPRGVHTLTAKATDNDRYQTVSAPVTIKVGTFPYVKITSPADQNQRVGQPVILSADASQPNGSITKVEFYNGETFLSTDYTAPYNFTVNNLPLGSYTFIAVATDELGITNKDSRLINVVDPRFPIVTLTSPSPSRIFRVGDQIKFSAEASDAEGPIISVKFYANGTYLKTDFSAPYEYFNTSLPEGTYKVYAKATDNNSNQTLSDSVTIYVWPKATLTTSRNSNNSETEVTGIELQLSPNPTQKLLSVSIKGLAIEEAVSILSIMSSNGTIMKQMKMNAKMQTISVDISTLQSGTYTLQLKSGDNIITKQFIKL